jgi:hypothetical protein
VHREHGRAQPGVNLTTIMASKLALASEYGRQRLRHAKAWRTIAHQTALRG